MEHTHFEDILSTVGNTPMVKLGANVYAKVEYVNPSGSVKDRMALFMIEAAERKGIIKPGDTLIEATSGNTGIGMSFVCAVKGYNMVVVMPEDMSQERKQLIRAFGAEIVLTSAKDSFAGSLETAQQLVDEKGHVMLGQFSNPDNIECHRTTTGQEILKQLGSVDAFVAGTGTGGTLMGVGAALKEKFPDVRIVAVEPAESAVMSGGEPGPHMIQGIGDGFIPDLVDMGKVHQVVCVESEKAVERCKRMAVEQGLLCGISSGANVLAAEQVSRELGPEKNVVTLLPDRCERYMSMVHQHSE